MSPKGKRRALYEMFDANDPGSRSVPQTALRRPHMHQPDLHGPAAPDHAPAPPPAEPAPARLRRAEPAPLSEPKIAPRPVREDGGFPLAPGKSVRVPSGYLFFGGGLLIALLIAAFALGHARGERAAELRLAAEFRQGETPAIVEPLNGTPTAAQPQQAQPQPQTTTRPTRPTGQRQPTTPAAPAPPTRTPGGALIVTRDNADPRTPGENYLFVALRGPEEAVEIAEFLAANGVPAGVFESNRPTMRQVVALRGFPPEAIRGQNNNEYQRFRQNIRDLGREWATRTRGSQNFDDLYPVRYNP